MEPKVNVLHRKLCKRTHEIGNAHFLTFSCFQRLPYLIHNGTCLIVYDSVLAACRKLDCSLWAYVLMPNHVHLLIRPRSANFKMGEFLWQTKRPAAKLRFKAYPHLDSKMWQEDGGYDRNLFSEGEIVEKLQYIHQNPVRRGLAEEPRLYRWSSASSQCENIQELTDLSAYSDCGV